VDEIQNLLLLLCQVHGSPDFAVAFMVNLWPF